MAPPISPLLGRHKLDASFDGTTVTHITRESNLEARQRLVQVTTVWTTEDRIGAGAFGVVWRQKADTGKLRAVKVIARDKLNLQEVEALIDLQDHPALFIKFSGWFENIDRDTIHIAMEYIEHGDLGKYIAEFGTKVEAREITSQILEGLVVLHEREICHRDLKPQNILVASLAPIWVKISDFGISKRWVGTTLKTRCGTVIYSSPEQLGILPRQYRASENTYTHTIDIWALGVIVHEMLTLEVPFRERYSNSYSDPYSDLTLSLAATAEQTVDTAQLYEYCKGAILFPCDSLQRANVNADGIDFVKSLMIVNPAGRPSAVVSLASRWVQTRSVSQLRKPEIPTVAGPSRSAASSDMAKKKVTNHREREQTQGKVVEVYDEERRGGEQKSSSKEERRSSKQQGSRSDDSPNMKIDAVRANMTSPGHKFSKEPDSSLNNRDGYSSKKQGGYSSGKRVSYASNNRDGYSSNNQVGHSSRSINNASSSRISSSTRQHPQRELSSVKKSETKATAEAPVLASGWEPIHAPVEVPSYKDEPSKKAEERYPYVVAMAAPEVASPVLEDDFMMDIDIRMEDASQMDGFVTVDRETNKVASSPRDRQYSSPDLTEKQLFATAEWDVTQSQVEVPKLPQTPTTIMNRSVNNLSDKGSQSSYSKHEPRQNSNKELSGRRSYQYIDKVRRQEQFEEMSKEPNMRNSSPASELNSIEPKSMATDVPEPEPMDRWAPAFVSNSLIYGSSMEAEASQSGHPIPMEVDIPEPKPAKSSRNQVNRRISMEAEVLRPEPDDSRNKSPRSSRQNTVDRPIPMKVAVLQPKPEKTKYQSTSRRDTVQPQWQMDPPAQLGKKRSSLSSRPEDEMQPFPGGIRLLPSVQMPVEASVPSRQREMNIMKHEWQEYNNTETIGRAQVALEAPYPTKQGRGGYSITQDHLAIESTSPAPRSPSGPPTSSHQKQNRRSYEEPRNVRNTEHLGALNSPSRPPNPYPVTQKRSGSIGMQTVPGMEPTSGVLMSTSLLASAPDTERERGKYGESRGGKPRPHEAQNPSPGLSHSQLNYSRDGVESAYEPMDPRSITAQNQYAGEVYAQPSYYTGPMLDVGQSLNPPIIESQARKSSSPGYPVTRPVDRGTRQQYLGDDNYGRGAPRPEREDTRDRREFSDDGRAGQRSRDEHVPSKVQQDTFSGVSSYQSNQDAGPPPGTGRGRGGESSNIPADEYRRTGRTSPVHLPFLESNYPVGRHDSEYYQGPSYGQGYQGQPLSRQNTNYETTNYDRGQEGQNPFLQNTNYERGHESQSPDLQKANYEQGHESQPPYIYKANYAQLRERRSLSRQNSDLYDDRHYQHDYTGPVGGGQRVQSPILPVGECQPASATSPLPSPTSTTDRESQPRWRQWVGGLKDSVQKAVRK